MKGNETSRSVMSNFKQSGGATPATATFTVKYRTMRCEKLKMRNSTGATPIASNTSFQGQEHGSHITPKVSACLSLKETKRFLTSSPHFGKECKSGVDPGLAPSDTIVPPGNHGVGLSFLRYCILPASIGPPPPDPFGVVPLRSTASQWAGCCRTPRLCGSVLLPTVWWAPGYSPRRSPWPVRPLTLPVHLSALLWVRAGPRFPLVYSLRVLLWGCGPSSATSSKSIAAMRHATVRKVGLPGDVDYAIPADGVDEVDRPIGRGQAPGATSCRAVPAGGGAPNWSLPVRSSGTGVLDVIIVLVAPVSIAPLINSPPMVTLAITDDLSMRSSGDSGCSGSAQGLRLFLYHISACLVNNLMTIFGINVSGISYVPQSSSIHSMNSSGFVTPSYLTDHLRTRSIALLLDINCGVVRLGLVARDLVSSTVNVVRGVYLDSSSSRRSIVSLLGLVEPASAPSAFRISSTTVKSSLKSLGEMQNNGLMRTLSRPKSALRLIPYVVNCNSII
uniref:Uncharacterized protein n=1 Tax=Glossina austeni TaxID=7395 RepID=A0A1A9VWE9_GLOAU